MHEYLLLDTPSNSNILEHILIYEYFSSLTETALKQQFNLNTSTVTSMVMISIYHPCAHIDHCKNGFSQSVGSWRVGMVGSFWYCGLKIDELKYGSSSVVLKQCICARKYTFLGNHWLYYTVMQVPRLSNELDPQ